MRADNVSGSRPTGFQSPHLSYIFHAELNQLTGIAAILTYPLDVDVVEAEEQELKEEAELAAAEGS